MRRLQSLFIAFAGVLHACTMMDLDELELEPCDDHLDCFALAEQGSTAVDACFRCEYGECVRSGRMEVQPARPIGKQPTLRVEPEQKQEVVLGGDGRALILVESRSRESSVQGWMLGADGTLAYRDEVTFRASPEEPPTGKIHQYATDFVSGDEIIGIGVDVDGCARGLVRVGTASIAEPFVLSDAGILRQTQYDPAAVGTNCERTLGARSPAVAVATGANGYIGAMLIWAVADNEMRPGELTGPSPLVEVSGVGIEIQRGGASEDNKRTSPLSLTFLRSSSRGRASRAVPPRVAGVSDEDTPGFVVATADHESLRLTSHVAAPHHVSELTDEAFVADTHISEIEIASGIQNNGLTELLVAWTSGPSGSTRVRLARYVWNRGLLERTLPPSTVSEQVADVRSLHVTFAADAFPASKPAGGWAILWTEGENERVMTSLIRGADQATRPGSIAANSVAAFARPGASSPFSYALFSGARQGGAGLSLLACQQ